MATTAPIADHPLTRLFRLFNPARRDDRAKERAARDVTAQASKAAEEVQAARAAAQGAAARWEKVVNTLPLELNPDRPSSNQLYGIDDR